MISIARTTKNVLIAGEDRREFALMSEDYHDELRPRGPVERTMFAELVAAAWQLRRVRQMEAEACAGAESYADVLHDERIQQMLDRLACHHTRTERTFHRCLKELRAGIDRRSGKEALLFIDQQSKISKRTQPARLPSSLRLTGS